MQRAIPLPISVLVDLDTGNVCASNVFDTHNQFREDVVKKIRGEGSLNYLPIPKDKPKLPDEK